MKLAWYRLVRNGLLLATILSTALLFYFQIGWFADHTYAVPNREGLHSDWLVPTTSRQGALPEPTHRPPRPVDNHTEEKTQPASDKGLITLSTHSAEEHSFRRDEHFVPSKCSSSLQKKLWTTPWTSKLFHPEIKLLLTRADLNLAEYQRLIKYWMPFGFKSRQNMTYEELVSVVYLVPQANSIFDFPREKQRPRCLTCAIVGNGGILNGSRMGKEIDSHDMVFRVNRCVRKGYEEDVGNRTTHLVLMDRSLSLMSKKDIPKDKGLKYVFLTCRKNDYLYLKVAATSRNPKTKLHIDPADTRILHPDFVRYIHRMWENTTSFRPTTGGMMFFTALHAGCDQVSVYGMGFTRNFTEHYYDREFVRFKTVRESHDFKREMALLAQLDRDNIIDWYKRERKEQDPYRGPGRRLVSND